MTVQATTAARLRRGLSELLVITAGVLLALAADGWRAERVDRRLEAEYLQRLRDELGVDVQAMATARETIALNTAPLERLIQLDPSGRNLDFEQLAEDLAIATRFGWALPSATSATFDEMVSSGRLGLISDPRTRAAVVSYYADHDAQRRSIEARRTSFPSLTYELVRREPHELTPTPSFDLTASPDASTTLETLLEPNTIGDIRRAAMAQLNWGNHAVYRLSLMGEEAENLMKHLDPQG